MGLRAYGSETNYSRSALFNQAEVVGDFHPRMIEVFHVTYLRVMTWARHKPQLVGCDFVQRGHRCSSRQGSSYRDTISSQHVCVIVFLLIGCHFSLSGRLVVFAFMTACENTIGCQPLPEPSTFSVTLVWYGRQSLRVRQHRTPNSQRKCVQLTCSSFAFLLDAPLSCGVPLSCGTNASV